MAAPDPIRISFWRGEAPPPVVMRLVADNGVALKLIDPVYGIDQIDVRLYCVDDPTETALFTASYTGGTLSTKVFQELQTDGYAFDDVGYNVLMPFTAANFEDCVGGRDYVMDIRVTPTAQQIQVHTIWLRCVGAFEA